MRPFVLTLFALAATAGLAGCASEAPKKTEPAKAETPADATPRTGTVGLVSELKSRGLNADNWSGALGSIWTGDTEKNVVSVKYEVTIFYDDGKQGTVMLDRRPDLQPGQRVRVTGNRIEPLRR